jgi:hypothetical protein
VIAVWRCEGTVAVGVAPAKPAAASSSEATVVAGGRHESELARGTEVVAARPVLADLPVGDAEDMNVLDRERASRGRKAVDLSDVATAGLRPDDHEVALGDDVERLVMLVREDAVEEDGGGACTLGSTLTARGGLVVDVVEVVQLRDRIGVPTVEGGERLKDELLIGL